MIILMGVAGAGKSIQGRMLAESLGCERISTGDILRTYESKEVKAKLLSGQLFSDEEMIKLLAEVLRARKSTQEFILDGFPRSPKQVNWLLDMVSQKKVNLTAVLHIKASEAIVYQRLVERGRADDHEDAIRKRFDEYEKTVIPALAHFKKAGVAVYDINGEQSVEAVHEAILSVLKTRQNERHG